MHQNKEYREKNGQFFQSHLTKVNFKDDMTMEYVEFENMLTRNAEGDEILANTTSWTPMIGGKEISATDYRKLVKLDFVSTFGNLFLKKIISQSSPRICLLEKSNSL